jgi:hypothetical protein
MHPTANLPHSMSVLGKIDGRVELEPRQWFVQSIKPPSPTNRTWQLNWTWHRVTQDLPLIDSA